MGKSENATGGSHNDGDSAGIKSGVTKVAPFDSEAVGPTVDDSQGKQGYSTGRVTKNPSGGSASKYGKSFDFA